MSAEGQTVVPGAPRQASSLFELIERYRAALRDIDEAEGEINDEIGAELDALAASLPERAEAIAAVCRALNEEAEACDRLARPYVDRGKRKRAQADAMKARLKLAMEETGQTKIATPTATAALQKNPPSCELTVPEHEIERHVPEQFLERTTRVRMSDVLIALKQGTALPFARLKPPTTHLRFR